MEVKTIKEQLLFTTVHLMCFKEETIMSTGTGFIFEYEKPGNKFHYIITNKHVIEGMDKIVIEFNERIEDKPRLGEKLTINITKVEKAWFLHPDENIDLAILLISPILNTMAENNQYPFFKVLTKSIIPTNEKITNYIDAIEQVIFIGYPRAIYDKINLLPIVRTGITASPFEVDFDNMPIFLIDGSVFPGSSGSPVFICDVGGFPSKNGGFVIGDRLFFLGVLGAAFCKSDENIIEEKIIPVSIKQYVKTKEMIDLGIVYKSKLIPELIEKHLSILGFT